MKKYWYILLLLLLWTVLPAAEEIAVVAGFDGPAEVHRGSKKVKYASGAFLHSADELTTGTESYLGCKFVDGSASLRLFSNSRLLLTGAFNEGPLVKKAALTKGSVFVRVAADSVNFSFSTPNSICSPGQSAFLAKISPQGETQITVISGRVILNAPAAQAVEVVDAGKTALITADGKFTVRPTYNSDINAEELAVIEPATPTARQTLTIPLTDPQGKVKYVELTW